MADLFHTARFLTVIEASLYTCSKLFALDSTGVMPTQLQISRKVPSSGCDAIATVSRI